jgi:hypothetical protein
MCMACIKCWFIRHFSRSLYVTIHVCIRADNSMRMANLNVRLQVRSCVSTAARDMWCSTYIIVHPWNPIANSRMFLRKARLRGLGMGFFILCVVLNVYVDYGSCISYLQARPSFRSVSATSSMHLCAPAPLYARNFVRLPSSVLYSSQSWLGFLPMNIVMSGVSLSVRMCASGLLLAAVRNATTSAVSRVVAFCLSCSLWSSSRTCRCQTIQSPTRAS